MDLSGRRTSTNLVTNLSLILFLGTFLLPSIRLIAQNNIPGARWGHVLIYDPGNNNLLLFGGTSESGGGSYLDDTWIWEDNNWKKIDVPGPSARGFCAVAYHENRNSILLHGGRGNDGLVNSDLWEWDGSAWTQIETESDHKADHHQMVYIPEQNTILALGGWNGEDVSGETWFWSGEWKKSEIQSPPKRAAFSMVYDEGSKRVVLYGGLWINGQYADVWEWSDNKWRQLGGPYDNSSLDHHSMIYNMKSGRIVGFGGKNYRYVAQSRTFTIDNTEIVEITTEGPGTRHSFGFTYDTANNAAYLFGGKEYVDGQQLPLGDLWRWDGEKWEEVQGGGER